MDMSILKVSQGPILLCLSAVALSKGTIISQPFLQWELLQMCQAQQVLDDRAQQRLELLEKQMMLDLEKKHSLKLTAGTHRKSFSKRISKKRIFET